MVKMEEKKMHNLGTVVKFELTRTLKKPSFWLSILALPIIWGIFAFIGYSSQSQTMHQAEEVSKETFSFQITDESKVISKNLVENAGGKFSNSKEKSINEVKTGKLDAYYFIPPNLNDAKVEIYAKNSGLFENSKYRSVIKTILTNSSLESVNENKLAIINSTFTTEEKVYKDGEEYKQISEMIVPAAFLAIFFFVIVLLSAQMLTSTTEEKENRVTEMILTSISSKTLIVGKIISLIIIGLIQILILLAFVIIAYFVVSNFMDLPDITPFFSQIKWEFWPILTGVLTLLAGFMMFTGFLVGLGAAMPTAKDANNFFGVVIVLLMAPFFTMNMFLMNEPNFAVSFMSIFPLTSPISIMLRNTLGTLTFTDGIIGLSVLVISSIITISIAVRIFRYGTLAYGSKVNFKQIFAKK